MKYLLLAVSLMSTNVLASELIFPEMYEVLKVNGTAYKGSFFEQESRLSLPAGKHVVLYRYNELFEGDDDHVKLNLSHSYLLLIRAMNP